MYRVFTDYRVGLSKTLSKKLKFIKSIISGITVHLETFGLKK
jgi:hypothetical protein